LSLIKSKALRLRFKLTAAATPRRPAANNKDAVGFHSDLHGFSAWNRYSPLSGPVQYFVINYFPHLPPGNLHHRVKTGT
jgi:hypothetical protein